jgi:hypothetical protein
MVGGWDKGRAAVEGGLGSKISNRSSSEGKKNPGSWCTRPGLGEIVKGKASKAQP